MKLQDLWRATGCLGEFKDQENPEIDTLTRDSRKVEPNSLFLCRQGRQFDSHQVISEVFAKGAGACVVHRPVESAPGPCWQVEPTQEAYIASAFYQNPSKQLVVLGVTGTDGKSTTAWLATQLLSQLGIRVACLGTLGVWAGHSWKPWGKTTPEPEMLQEVLCELVIQGFTHVVMEVSSHGLSEGRVLGVDFDAVALTNLGRDHLDDYGTIEKYHGAKEILFKLQPNPSKQVRPQQSPGQAQWITGSDIRVTSRGFPHVKVFWPEGTWEGTFDLAGSHNHQNLATAFALVGCVEAKEKLVSATDQLKPLLGRWQWIEDSDQKVMVDYAHTPRALQTVLMNLRPFVKGELHVLFGCGGQRDPGKRPLMGQVASQWADYVWVTDDNPRHEDPQDIRRAIVQQVDSQKCREIAGRSRAIQEAVTALKEQDVLLIAGKGHETVQVIGGQTHPFDDVAIASEICREMYCGS